PGHTTLATTSAIEDEARAKSGWRAVKREPPSEDGAASRGRHARAQPRAQRSVRLPDAGTDVSIRVRRIDVLHRFATEGAEERTPLAFCAITHDEVGDERHFSATARRIANELGERDPRQAPLELLHDREAAREGRSEMAGAAHRIRLQQVVRAHAHADEAAEE